MTESHDPVMQRIEAFLENIRYKGFANFDIKFNASDGEFYILEMNLRTGRSNYYVTASGENIARFAVADGTNSVNTAKILCENEMLWHTVPKQIIYKYISDEETKQRVRNLIINKKVSSTLFYPYDMKLNPLRSCFVYIHNLRYFKKYKIYE